MASAGPKSFATFVNDPAVGTADWTNLEFGYAAASDGNKAGFFAIGASNPTTKYLKATDAGFDTGDIPDGATIDGFLQEWEKSYVSAAVVRDNAVRMVKGGTVQAGDRALGSDWPISDTYIAHGGASDLWDGIWADSDVRSTGFGAALSAEKYVSVNGGGAIDHVRITVFFTPAPPAAGGQSPFASQLI